MRPCLDDGREQLLWMRMQDASYEQPVYDGQPKQELLDKIKAEHENMQVFSLDEVRELGKARPPRTSRPSAPRTTTSRASCTMGATKGVVITQGNLIASLGAICQLLQVRRPQTLHSNSN